MRPIRPDARVIASAPRGPGPTSTGRPNASPCQKGSFQVGLEPVKRALIVRDVLNAPTCSAEGEYIPTRDSVHYLIVELLTREAFSPTMKTLNSPGRESSCLRSP